MSEGLARGDECERAGSSYSVLLPRRRSKFKPKARNHRGARGNVLRDDRCGTDGKLYSFTIENVRYVPGWSFTLISTRRLAEQYGIRSRVDLEPCGIDLPDGPSFDCVSERKALPTLSLISTARDVGSAVASRVAEQLTLCADSGAGTEPEPNEDSDGPQKQRANAGKSSRRLGFHRVGSSSYVRGKWSDE